MIVLETHVLVWWVDGDARKLSRKARQALKTIWSALTPVRPSSTAIA